MKRMHLLIFGLLLAAFLAACGGKQQAQPPAAEAQTSNEKVVWDLSETSGLKTVVDDQGAVSVAVTPINISVDASTLDFEVAMNTHSVDLSMDLAALATLSADNGRSVSATLWDAVPGGHHVSGKLSFPSSAEETTFIEGASQLTLIIRGVDAPERSFNWSIAN